MYSQGFVINWFNQCKIEGTKPSVALVLVRCYYSVLLSVESGVTHEFHSIIQRRNARPHKAELKQTEQRVRGERKNTTWITTSLAGILVIATHSLQCVTAATTATKTQQWQRPSKRHLGQRKTTPWRDQTTANDLAENRYTPECL